MEVIFANGVRFSIEFIKLMLVIVYICRYPVKKRINVFFPITLVGVMVFSCFFDLSQISVIYGIISIYILRTNSCGKHRLEVITLSYITISLIDMLFANVCISIFHINIWMLENNLIVIVLLNSISLVLIIITALILNKNKQLEIQRIPQNFVPVFIAGGLSVSVYLTGVQFMGLGEEFLLYRSSITIGFCVSAIIFLVICVLLIKNKNENEYLKMENSWNQILLKSQNDYYLMLLQKEKETKEFRHDIKEHILCLQMLYQQERYKELGTYLSEIKDTIKELSPKISTGNAYVNAIVGDLMNQYTKVNLEWKGHLPELKMSQMDICTLFYNLLKNAFEATDTHKDKNVWVVCKVQYTNLIIEISNNYSNVVINSENEFLSTKKEEGHGYGIKNIRKCVDKNGGKYSVCLENHIFKTEIILPDSIKSLEPEKIYDER